MHEFCYTMIELESRYERDDLIHYLEPVRSRFSKSNVLHRFQKWPEGYQGDYVTVEMLCESSNSCTPDSLEFYFEEYTLNCAMPQQHRNKVHIQAGKILSTILMKDDPKILIVGAGSGADVREIQHLVKDKNYSLHFNDIDQNALDYTRSKLDPNIIDRSLFIQQNIISYIKNMQKDNLQFDLVLFGGVFDYLTDKQIKFILKNIYSNSLKSEGEIFFTNVAENNPYRVLMEYGTDWFLKERTESEISQICASADISDKCVSIAKETTGITYIVEIKKY